MATADFRVYSTWLARGSSLAAVQPDGATITTRGCIGLQGESGYRLFLHFLDEGQAVPSPTYDPEGLVGTLYLPLSQWADYVDLVRATTGLWAHVDSERPENNAVQSVAEVDTEAIRRT